MKIYVASSWRNTYQPSVVSMLRDMGHEVYDFRNPAPGDNGFSWRDVAPDWEHWDFNAYMEGLRHPVALAGFSKDKEALDASDLCVLVLPCGRSAHLEAGYMAGQGKRVIVFIPDAIEPELMYHLTDKIVDNAAKLFVSVQDVEDAYREARA